MSLISQAYHRLARLSLCQVKATSSQLAFASSLGKVDGDGVNYNEPKRYQNAWLIYVTERFQSIKLEHPSLNPNALYTLISKEFRILPKEKMAVYERRSLADKERYAREVSELKEKLQNDPAFKEQFTEAQNQRKLVKSLKTHERKLRGINKRLVAEGLPTKLPLNAFNLFVREHYDSLALESKQIGQGGIGSIASELGKIWLNSDEATRKRYEDRAALGKVKYNDIVRNNQEIYDQREELISKIMRLQDAKETTATHTHSNK